jgi:hypothetical protein
LLLYHVQFGLLIEPRLCLEYRQHAERSGEAKILSRTRRRTILIFSFPSAQLSHGLKFSQGSRADAQARPRLQTRDLRENEPLARPPLRARAMRAEPPRRSRPRPHKLVVAGTVPLFFRREARDLRSALHRRSHDRILVLIRGDPPSAPESRSRDRSPLPPPLHRAGVTPLGDAMFRSAQLTRPGRTAARSAAVQNRDRSKLRCLERSRVCSAPLRASALRAALRPGHEIPFDRNMLQLPHSNVLNRPRSRRVSARRTTTLRLICRKTRYAATRSAPPGGTRSKGSRILTIVPLPSGPDVAIVPPS